MAINSVVLEVVTKVAQMLPRPRRMLCLGYPDMLVTEAQIAKFCGEEVARDVAWRDDSESILRWHGLQGRMTRVAESRSLFSLLGIETDFVDITASRGFEIVLDLNRESPAGMLGRYDIVYDGGTMEHCFNVGQVMRNIFGFARVGGFIVHVNPLNYYNHGFFNFNPTFYHDWYTQGGNTMASPFYVMSGPVLESRVVAVDPTGRFQAPERSVQLVAAMKNSEVVPDWPMQTKYLQNSELRS
jgi:hypothetical protein